MFPEEGNSISNKKLMRQCLLGIAVTIDCFIAGAGSNYSATLLPQLSMANSTLPITKNEGTWIASVLLLACLPGTIAGSFLVEWIGRKWTYILVSLTNTLSWLVIGSSYTVWQILLGRTLLGLAWGMSYPACYCLVGEVVMVKYRSMFLNIINIGGTFGMLYSDLMGTYCSWRLSAFVIVALALTYFCILLHLSDTHVWNLHHNRWHEARHAFFWYHKECPESIQLFNEYFVHYPREDRISVKMVIEECGKREFLLPFLIMFWFISTVVFTGGSGIAAYSIDIMNRVVQIDEYITTIIIDVIRILAALTTILVLKYLPIRLIINTCSALCALLLLLFCAALQWDQSWEGFQWTALLAIVFFYFFYSVGYVNISNISMGELFTGVTKGLGITLTTLTFFVADFILLQLIPRMFSGLGNIWTFLIFACCNIVGGIGLFIFMPETRNISNEEIRENFKRNFRRQIADNSS